MPQPPDSSGKVVACGVGVQVFVDPQLTSPYAQIFKMLNKREYKLT